MKKMIKYLLSLLFIALVVYACADDILKEPDGQLKEDARSWYQDNTVTSALKSVQESSCIRYIPEWDIYFTAKDKEYDVVETSLAVEGMFTLVHPSVIDKYKNTKDPRYKQSATRYIFRKDKKTGETYGFLMTFIPNLAYLEATNFRPFRRMSYLDREQNLGGFVFYYSLDGDFINGWSYENGEVVASMQPEPVQDNEGTSAGRLKSGGCQTYYVHEIYEVCNSYGQTVSIGGMESGGYTDRVCYQTSVSVGSYTSCDGTGSGNVDPGGGKPNNNTSSSKAKKIFRNSSMNNSNWTYLENMLNKIAEDCMGLALYNGLVSSLNGKTLTIEFNNSNTSYFSFDGGTAGINISMEMESNRLFHEMFHAYQAYQETTLSFSAATLNLEIEAFYAQYIYLSRRPEYSGSKWEGWYTNDPLFYSIAELGKYVNDKGTLNPGKTRMMLDIYILNGPLAQFQSNPAYRNSSYDYNRSGDRILNNLKTLSRGCL